MKYSADHDPPAATLNRQPDLGGEDISQTQIYTARQKPPFILYFTHLLGNYQF